jgi:hypothetical protein
VICKFNKNKYKRIKRKKEVLKPLFPCQFPYSLFAIVEVFAIHFLCGIKAAFVNEVKISS